MAFKPITFLANVKRIFSAATGLTTIAYWGYPGITVASYALPAIFLEIVDAHLGSQSTSVRDKEYRLFVRFVLYAETTAIDDYFDAIVVAIRANPYLLDVNNKKTCELFGSYEDNISFSIVSTEVVGKQTIHGIHIDVPCRIRD
ncbi:MAG: hypothetical protein WC319_04760 [Candidatus Paceibacterota bacterium]|jgi:hypothetical protein